MQELLWLIAPCYSYLISPSISVTFIPMGFLNIVLLRVPASLIFILNATTTAASLQPFAYWKGEWITRELKLIDAERCDKSAAFSFLFSPLLMCFLYSLQFLCRCIFQGSQTCWDVKWNNEKSRHMHEEREADTAVKVYLSEVTGEEQGEGDFMTISLLVLCDLEMFCFSLKILECHNCQRIWSVVKKKVDKK